MLQEAFTDAAQPAGWSVTTTADGSVSFPGGTAVLVSTATGTAELLSPIDALTMDGQSQAVLVTAASSFNGIIILRMGTSPTDFCPAFHTSGANWTPSRYRDATGVGSLPSGAVNFSKTLPQWLRFVRASATTFTLESAPDVSGTPGTWTVRATTDASDSLVIDMPNARLEFLCTATTGNLTIDRVGDGLTSLGNFSQFYTQQLAHAGLL